jgi:hypothetical protein
VLWADDQLPSSQGSRFRSRGWKLVLRSRQHQIWGQVWGQVRGVSGVFGEISLKAQLHEFQRKRLVSRHGWYSLPRALLAQLVEHLHGKEVLDASPDDLGVPNPPRRAPVCKLERLTPNQPCFRLTREPIHEAELRCRRSRPFAPVRSEPPIRPRGVPGRSSDCCHTARVVAHLGTKIRRYAGISSGRYWARRSDPQLVDLVQPFAPVRSGALRRHG